MKLDPLATITQEKPHKAKTKSSPDNKSARMKRSYSLQMWEEESNMLEQVWSTEAALSSPEELAINTSALHVELRYTPEILTYSRSSVFYIGADWWTINNHYGIFISPWRNDLFCFIKMS